MTKFIYIALFTLFGILLMPTVEVFACKKEDKAHTKQSHTVKKDKELHSDKHCKKSCCKQSSCSKHGRNCKGNCGDASCQCATTCVVFILPTFYDYFQKPLIASKESIKYPTDEAFYASGFLSIWLPPKIS
jgi:hypothetical protein